MSINYKDFIHPSDQKALTALKSLPGFDFLVKKFMSIYSEKVNKLQTTSSMIRLGENQLPEIYSILVKVCKKLQISVPELYLKLDREPNAYTMGDTDVFIVIHSGLLETMSLEQVETIIAHECGHIVCHHNLYTTMCIYIMQGAEYFINGPISNAIFTAIQYAFFYWMRCSEFSADRVAAYYHGSADQVVNVMMALAGATNNLNFEFTKDEFFKQAVEYKQIVDNSVYNKALEFITFGLSTHPLIAYRAYEIDQFYKSKQKLLTASRTENLETNECKYTINIEYEFIRPKNILKLNSVLDNKPLEVIIGIKKYEIEQGKSLNVDLKEDNYSLLIKNKFKETTYEINMNNNKNVIITWDGNLEDYIIECDVC